MQTSGSGSLGLCPDECFVLFSEPRHLSCKVLLFMGGEMGAGKLMLAGKSVAMGKSLCRLHMSM